jgi:predicted nucleotidyltransferase component of viral defense system
VAFLGLPKVKQKENNNTLIYRFESEFPPVQTLKLKVETNCREHFTVLGYQKFPFEVNSTWFTGKCDITTYKLEELLGTKLGALYQRRKGRDLYDMYNALKQTGELNIEEILKCYHAYMSFVVEHPPTPKMYQQNLEIKMKDDDFLGDITALIRPNEIYDPQKAFEILTKMVLEKM